MECGKRVYIQYNSERENGAKIEVARTRGQLGSV